MATVAELQSAYSDVERKYNNATAQKISAEANLIRQQDVQKYNLSEADKYEAIASAAVPDSPEQIAALASMSKQKANAAAVQKNIDNAQKEVDGWAQQISDFRAALDTAQSELSAAKTAEAEVKSKAEDTKAGSAPPNIDNTKASATVADGDKAGDSNSTPATTTTPTAASTTTSTTTPNAGTTTAGAAGTNPSTGAASIVGKRTYNPLGDFSSYTYKIGLYMLNSSDFNSYMSGDYTKVSKFKLIAQSGGVTESLDSPRAPGFDLDLYIDDLEILTKVNNKETMSATNSCEFKFKIYEPYGFSFPHTLAKAQVAAQQAKAGAADANAQIVALKENFLLTIKFYGYDKNGKLVTSADYPQADISKSDTQSVFERGFPIKIKDFKFKLENKVTVYSITAVQVTDQVAKGVNFGTLPTNLTVAGETIQDVLVGASQESSKKSIWGMVQGLNSLEKSKVVEGKITYPNEYAIEFEQGTSIGDARLVPKDYYVKERAPFNSIHNADGSNERTAWKNRLGSIEKEIRTVEMQAGTSIIQAIDQVITQSEYLKNMMTAVDKEIDQPVQDTESTVDKNPNPKTLSWYNISNTVKINSPERDPKTNEYAYKITYKVLEYQIPYIRSLYTSKTSSYYGPHKKYNYWYTGKNSEILSYEQDYNLLYNVDAAYASEAATKNAQSATISQKSAMNADSTNSKSGTNDVINSVKSFLYSPQDLLKFKLKILGDPDYLMPSVGLAGTNGLQKWYGDNLTINPNSGQVFIEIYFEQGSDYDNTNGLLIPNGDIQFMNYPKELKSKIKGMVYMLTNVTSTFSKGKFEQSLSGIIPEFAKAGDTATTPPVAPNSRAAASTPATTNSNSNSDSDPNTNANESPADNSTSSGSVSSKASDTTDAVDKTTVATPTSQGTSPATTPETPSTPAEPPKFVAPNPSPTARTTFNGAMIKAYQDGSSVSVPIFLPSGKELKNVLGWDAQMWDGQIEVAKPQDLEVLKSLKDSYSSVIQPLVDDVTAKISANAAAKKEHETLVANWGKTAGTGSSTPTGKVADDDSGG